MQRNFELKLRDMNEEISKSKELALDINVHLSELDDRGVKSRLLYVPQQYGVDDVVVLDVDDVVFIHGFVFVFDDFTSVMIVVC